MFCSTCGTTITPGLSFCNRCGASLKERTEPVTKTGAITAFLIAITLIAIVGLGIMLGGALTLKRDAALGEDVVGMFMFFTFFILCVTEFFLARQLSKLIGSKEPKHISAPPPATIPNELRAAPARVLQEAVPSVTENTTRTLEYSRNEPPR
ncbi:MAG TPA: zinc ribbon domain-containing protein [Pyrinomonadaceae bacterium]|nr:zinc ribbon domain-containing protein [Pyrinomonadaceae bacterium]